MDPDAAALEAIRRATQVFPCVQYVQAEPAEFLRRWPEEHPGKKIHLLYLDSVETEGTDAIDRRHVEGALAAEPAMAERGLVLFRKPRGEGLDPEGEAGRVARYLSERGFQRLWAEDGWVLLVFIDPGAASWEEAPA